MAATATPRLSEVDWYEIAEHMVADCDWQPEPEEAYDPAEDTR